jgi:hypothetical protein
MTSRSASARIFWRVIRRSVLSRGLIGYALTVAIQTDFDQSSC